MEVTHYLITEYPALTDEEHICTGCGLFDGGKDGDVRVSCIDF